MIPVLLCVIFAVSAFMTVTASAATAGQDGVEAELTFSKTEYKAGEDLDATLTVRNLNPYPVHNVQTKIVLPEGMKLAAGSLPSKAFTLAANETKTYEAALAKETVPDTPKKGSDPGAGSTSSKTAKTGDDSDTGIFIALMLLSGGVLVFVMVRRKRHHGKDVIPFILCFIVLGAVMLPMTADAAGKQKEFSVGDTVKVDGKEVTVKAVISYDHVVHSGVTVNSGTVVNPTGTNLYKEGETVTITADQAPEGKHFSGWTVVSGGAVLADNTKETTTFEMPANDVEITANYAVNVYTIEATAGEGGEISPPSATVNYGGSQKFTIKPERGYHIEDVKVDDKSVGVKDFYIFNDVKDTHTIEAVFAITPAFEIAVTAGEGGVVSPGTTTVKNGDSQGFTITPDKGYHIADVVVDGQSKGAITTYTFTDVKENHNISATFADNVEITVDAGNMTFDQLKKTIADALDNGFTDITINGNLSVEQQNAAGEALREWCWDTKSRQGTISLTLSDVIQVSDNAFKGLDESVLSALKSLNLPQATTIGEYAFEGQKYLESVTAPNIEIVGKYAFNGCSSLSSFNWDKVKIINKYSFINCDALKNVNLPVATTLGQAAFAQCDELESVTAPLVTEVSHWAFSNCQKLTSLSFGSAITSWGGQVMKFVPTGNITLTLANGQKELTGGRNDIYPDDTCFFKVADGAPDMEDGVNKEFCEYIFKEIKLTK